MGEGKEKKSKRGVDKSREKREEEQKKMNSGEKVKKNAYFPSLLRWEGLRRKTTIGQSDPPARRWRNVNIIRALFPGNSDIVRIFFGRSRSSDDDEVNQRHGFLAPLAWHSWWRRLKLFLSFPLTIKKSYWMRPVFQRLRSKQSSERWAGERFLE